ncbi:MAG: hypothetical protein GW903_06865 [Alphaproteobacteria bacterium]|nr:hypothetical protein [Alphaproteobacteria bacterium]NCQ88604.1 hypothetical protein [Alphaproteobacteria bacterium]NCT06147.1 hypothetical protein [Alphaproteobacteria bacterium]
MAEKIQQSLLFLLIIAALIGVASQSIAPPLLLSLFLSITGFLVLLRFLGLYARLQNKGATPSLPQKLLKGLNEERAQQNRAVIKRISEPDFIIWSAFVMLSLIWLFICTLYPAPMGAIKTIHFEFISFLNDFYAHQGVQEPSITMKLKAPFFIALAGILVTFLIFSFSDSRSFVRFSYIVLLPLFFILLGFTALTSGLISFFVWPDAQFWKGGGVDTARKIFLLHSNVAFDSGSFFLARFIETGFIGAYLFYLLIFPALCVFFHILTVRRRRVVPAFIGMGVTTILIVVDLFWIYTPFVNAIFVSGWVIIACSWAQSGYKTACLKR